MEKNNQKLVKELSKKLQFPKANASERTTFKLNRKSIDSLKWISEQLHNLSIKDTLNVIIDYSPSNDENQQFESLMNELRKVVMKGSPEESVRKTYVIGKRQLKVLNGLAEKIALDRDLLLSILIECFRTLLLEKIESDKKHLKNIYKKLEHALALIESIKDSADEYRVFKECASTVGFDESEDIRDVFPNIEILLGVFENLERSV